MTTLGTVEVVDLSGRVDSETGIRYLGLARRMADGRYRVLADVRGSLCVVEVRLACVVQVTAPGKGN